MSTARFRKQGGYKQARNIGTSSMNADGGISTRSHISFHDLKDIPGATANMPPGTLIWKSLPLGNGRLEYKDNSNYWNILGTGAYDLWKPGTADYIYYDGGNVGIGIGNPAAKLHVIGNIHVNTENYKNQIGYFTGASGATGTSSTAIGYNCKASGDYSTAMGYQTLATGAYSTAMGAYSGATGNWSTAIGNRAYAGGDIQFAIGASGQSPTTIAGAANNNNVLSILKNGNVGIGTTGPAAKLHVIGNIHVNTDNYKNEIGYFTGASGATGNNSTAIGYQTKASGDYSTAMGQSTTASGAWSTAMGWDTLATGGSQSICCTAMGYGTIASWTSTAMGYKTIASGEYSTAMGQSTLASNWTSTAMGYHTIASGSASTAMGTDSTATGTRSTAMGLRTDAGGSGSTAMGTLSTASGDYSTAIGNGAYTGGDIQFAIGASGTISPHSADSAANMNVLSILKNGNVGIGTTGPAAKLHVIGNIHVNTDNYKNEIGYFTGASGATGNNSTAIGYNCKASGDYSTAMGYSTTASGEASTAMGYNTVAGASWGTKWSTAMGYHTIASGDSSTAMGWWSKASGTYSTAMGAFSLAEDEYCTAIGNKAYAGGDIQFAIGASGTAPGAGTTAGSNFNVLSILKNGNVGIGTTGPAAKLDISGNIHVNIDNYKNEIGYFTGASGATGNNSTAIGYQTKASGDYSTAIGYQTLATGAYSTAMGFRAVAGNFSTAMGYNCKASGNYSTAMGVDTKATSNSSTAMGRDTIASGISSTAMGAYSGATGDYCTAIGNKAYAGGDIQFAIGASGTAPGAGATAGSNFNVLSILKNGNVGIGTTGPTEKLDVDGDALINGITVGLGGSNISENTVVGYQALQVNTTGNKNVAVGHSALKKAETADRNTAVGFEALTSHTFGSENTAVGFQALTVSDGGTLNVAVGNQALNKLTVGEKNTAIGYWAGYEVTTGEGNTIIGYNAGNDITSGVYNTIIGYQAQGYDNDNNIIIGSGAQAVLAEGDNQIRLGNTDIGYAGIQVAWTVASDERIKSDIQNSNLGLNFINKLRPVSYYRNSDKSKKKEYGFIAQELDTVLNNAGASNNGIISKNDAGIYSVRYNDLIAPMVKAIQQQQEMINTLQQEIKSLNKNS